MEKDNNSKKIGLGVALGIVLIALLIVIGIYYGISLKSKKTTSTTNSNNTEEKNNERYMTKGEYYLYVVKEFHLGSSDYDEEDYKSDKGPEIAADIMYDCYLIEDDQMKNLNKPVTKEIVAQTLVRYMEFREEHNIEISDINNCVDKQAIIDAVGMGIFGLEKGKFKPNEYMTQEEVDKATYKMMNIEANSHYPEDDRWGEKDSNIVDKWSDLKITLNNKEYDFTKNLKVSDFINNGWKETGDEEIINKTIEDVLKSMSNSDVIYINHNTLQLEQDNLFLLVYYDMSIPNNKVIDSRAITISAFSKETNISSDFNFKGIKLGQIFTEKEFKEKFGENNVAIWRDAYRHYYKKSVELSDGFKVELKLITNVDTDELFNIDISEKNNYFAKNDLYTLY